MGMATRLTDLRKQPPSQPIHKQTSIQADEATSRQADKQTNGQVDMSTSRLADLSPSGVVDKAASPLVGMSASGQVDLPTSVLVNPVRAPQARFQRKTYYLQPNQVERIEWVAFHQKLDISEVVRQAVQAHLDKLGVPEIPR